MEKKELNFELPTIEFVEIDDEDIITTSGVTASSHKLAKWDFTQFTSSAYDD